MYNEYDVADAYNYTGCRSQKLDDFRYSIFNITIISFDQTRCHIVYIDFT